MEITVQKGDKVVLDYISLDKSLRKAYGKAMPDKVEGVVSELTTDSSGKTWFTLKGTENDNPQELYPLERIVKINGKKV